MLRAGLRTTFNELEIQKNQIETKYSESSPEYSTRALENIDRNMTVTLESEKDVVHTIKLIDEMSSSALARNITSIVDLSGRIEAVRVNNESVITSIKNVREYISSQNQDDA